MKLPEELKSEIEQGAQEAEELSAMLIEATETKPDHRDPEPILEPEKKQDEPVKPDESDFEPRTETEPVSFEPVQKPEPPVMPFGDQAELIVGFIDGLQSIVLPNLYSKAIFNGQERDQIMNFKKAGKKESEFKKENPELAEKYFDYVNLVDDIPFTNDEIRMVKSPLEAVMKKYNWNVGPEFLLVGALFTVMSPRIIPLFSKLG
jgi:hypothetical protein